MVTADAERPNGAAAMVSDDQVGESSVVLACEGLRHSLGSGQARHPVLHGVDLSLRAGELVAVVGPSGCGKSTLLYLLGLLDRPDAGEILLDGQPVARAQERDRDRARGNKLGFIFQFHHLLAEFTARENLALPLIRQGWKSEEAYRRADFLLAEIGLGEKVQRLAARLSGGEQQRVAVARALAGCPSAVLADEPTGNLDAANADSVFQLLLDLARRDRAAVLLVTHNRELAERCDRTLEMRDGRFS